MNEGELRSKELSKFLDDHKTRKSVWLSEDATALMPKIKYDPTTDQIVGILLPMNENGLPTPFRYSLLNFEYDVHIYHSFHDFIFCAVKII